jgi:hypothetical protein
MRMDRDVLERLATDRALGALSGDVKQLLDAYKRLDPAAATEADQIDTTVSMARAALAEKPPSSMPAFPVAGFQQIERWRRRVQQFTYAAGLAACLSIGLGLGRMTAPATPIPVPGATGAEVVQKPEADASDSDGSDDSGRTQLARSNPSGNDAGFWSVERLMQQREQEEERVQAPSPSSPSIRVQWPRYNRPT